jgi:hypothetical protein
LTSTRFEMDRAFSRTMMLRARYLLERLLAHRAAARAEDAAVDWAAFSLDRATLVP